eukprot:COSAG02_NODE_999_length_15328_cov_8.086360_3_plen_143_part_00
MAMQSTRLDLMLSAGTLLLNGAFAGLLILRSTGDPVKHMRSLVVERKPLPEFEPASKAGGGIVTITATCNRFLWNMMRRIVGTLVQVGLGKMSEEAVSDLLTAKGQPTSRLPVYTAPARGLCLDQVFYEHDREVEGSWFTPS